MESRVLYTAINSLKHKIDWELQSENEWLHIGLGHDLRKDFFLMKISELFKKDKIFIVLGRENSKEISKEIIEKQIIPEIGKEDFILCNEKFSKFMEFDKIGVIRIGKK